ncbi:hypothetical protein SERLA73DRAFT_73737 [Serpula lacrymans var. lacrymans S7.3]|uniref:Uncharacterized protein n=2 Tax=Serpula lacrymans var. lacrymans TaxID=341189 RepID=F8PZ74_SERL3|nr:uncharacterized protein SERLADRAFT_438365 [Serpula lacrymans var. lacrymans S7.9]EGN99187.1 hypothetical protein SERLA73DRAFT_73737 [Serpula lacrymans var. lacrymans S7.3]EGO24753.1 hypothetical protein SERLADRAFT_438365 [Serpula lacrymans var. lacrymans S7.9]
MAPHLPTDDWFNNLSEGERMSWTLVERAFYSAFPKWDVKIVHKDPFDVFQKLKLTENELGKIMTMKQGAQKQLYVKFAEEALLWGQQIQMPDKAGEVFVKECIPSTVAAYLDKAVTKSASYVE